MVEGKLAHEAPKLWWWCCDASPCNDAVNIVGNVLLPLLTVLDVLLFVVACNSLELALDNPAFKSESTPDTALSS